MMRPLFKPFYPKDTIEYIKFTRRLLADRISVKEEYGEDQLFFRSFDHGFCDHYDPEQDLAYIKIETEKYPWILCKASRFKCTQTGCQKWHENKQIPDCSQECVITKITDFQKYRSCSDLWKLCEGCTHWRKMFNICRQSHKEEVYMRRCIFCLRVVGVTEKTVSICEFRHGKMFNGKCPLCLDIRLFYMYKIMLCGCPVNNRIRSGDGLFNNINRDNQYFRYSTVACKHRYVSGGLT
jgi:hypothetical protein